MADMLEMDPNKIREMADSILADAKKYMDQVDGVRDEVTTLGTHWTGEAYNAFKNTFETSYNSCVDLYTNLQQIADNIDATGEAGAKTEQEMLNVMNG